MRLGITGHQGLDSATAALVKEAIAQELAARGAVRGIGSLAEGADQIFAEAVLRGGGSLTAIIPSAGYERAFSDDRGRERYRSLRERSAEIIEMPFQAPSDEAYWAAGQKVVQLCEELLAIWDGQPAGGLGGTADVVAYARERNVPVTVIWPEGSSRE